MGRRTLPALLGTQLASSIGSATTAFALALWVHRETGSATLLGVLFLATVLPGIAVGPLAGTLVDRVPVRRVMLLADSAAAVATAVLLAVHLAGGLRPWHVLAGVALISAAGAFQEPAYGSAVPQLATPEALRRVNGIVQLGPALGMVVAPGLAGLLLAAGALEVVFALDLVSFVVAVATLARLRFPAETAPSAPSTAPRGVRAGWTALRARPGLLTLTYLGAVLNFLLGFTNVLLIPLLLGFASPAAAGVVVGGIGVGMLAGAVAAASLRDRGRPTVGIALGTLVLGAGIVLIGARPSLPVVTLGVLLLGTPVPFISATSMAVTQRAVAAEVLGRVLALRRTVATAALPLAYVLAGPMVDRVFGPALEADGALAGSVGRLIGTGAGRGAGAVFVLSGVGVLALGLHVLTSRRVAELDHPAAGVAPAAPTNAVAGVSPAARPA